MSIHLEVCLFVIVTVLTTGWGTGGGLYLIAIASLVYFCPFDHHYIPYLFSVVELLTLCALKLYTSQVQPVYRLTSVVEEGLYIYSACICFFLLLYAAFTSEVSANVSKKVLQDENRSLNTIANFDQLTGLPNRHFLMKKLENCRMESVILGIGDLDNFKHINDRYGHNCGDIILQSVAELFRNVCGNAVEICRWGGEEFLFLFQDSTLQEAYARLERVRTTIREHRFIYEGEEVRVSITIGVSDNPGEQGFSELLETADKLLYAGKTGGKDRVVRP